MIRIVDPLDPRLERFHRGIYWDAFAAQHEPLEAWRAALAGTRPYRLAIELATDGDDLVAGIAYELYPESRCGFVTYVVVAPSHRRHGLGRALIDGAVARLVGDGARAVFAEVNDPERTGEWERLARFRRWGARVVDARYIQPSLGEGLARDRGLLLIAFAPAGETIAGAIVRSFVEELYRATEGGAPDPDVAIPDVCALR